MKGDLTGISQTGKIGDKIVGILKERGIDKLTPTACPSALWDVFGALGHPVCATISDMGPLLLGRMLNLNDTQAGVLNIIFKIADDNGMLLLHLKDLRAMLQCVGDNGSEFTTRYGNVSAASVGAIQRELLQTESQVAEKFFGDPMLYINDFMQTTDGQHVINILAAEKPMNSPRPYATFLLLVLSELFEQLPEVGGLKQPKLALFFNEAHLLFNEAPKLLVERTELVVLLVRSKSAEFYFVMQNPLALPDSVLAQLGCRVQHVLCAFTPRDLKAVKATVQTMRQKPGLDIKAAITELAVSETLVSLPDAKGRPSVTERIYVFLPGSQIGPITPEQQQALLQNSIVAGVDKKAQDHESALEKTAMPCWGQSCNHAKRNNGGAAGQNDSDGIMGGLKGVLFGSTGPRGGVRDGLAQSMAKSAVRTMGCAVGREIIRGVLWSSLRKKRRKC